MKDNNLINSRGLVITQVPIGDLKVSDYNPRGADEKDIEQLKKSIEEFGLVDPLIVNSNSERMNIIIGGHFRLRIAKELGFTEVPVVYVNIKDLRTEQKLNLRLNRNLGRWDNDLLKKLDKDLLLEIGFGEDELKDMLSLGEDNFDADAVYDSITEPKAKRGDIYALGEHRLMCGDSTSPEDIKELMMDRSCPHCGGLN